MPDSVVSKVLVQALVGNPAIGSSGDVLRKKIIKQNLI
jgi:hypothetical protein